MFFEFMKKRFIIYKNLKSLKYISFLKLDLTIMSNKCIKRPCSLMVERLTTNQEVVSSSLTKVVNFFLFKIKNILIFLI